MAYSFWPLIKFVGGDEHLEMYPIVIIQPHAGNSGGIFTPSVACKNEPHYRQSRSAGRSLPCDGCMSHSSPQLISS